MDFAGTLSEVKRDHVPDADIKGSFVCLGGDSLLLVRHHNSPPPTSPSSICSTLEDVVLSAQSAILPEEPRRCLIL